MHEHITQQGSMTTYIARFKRSFTSPFSIGGMPCTPLLSTLLRGLSESMSELHDICAPLFVSRQLLSIGMVHITPNGNEEGI